MFTFLNYQWVEVDEDSEVITIGLTEEGMDQIEEIRDVRLPSLEENVSPIKVCMEIYTNDGAFNIYSPVEGQIIEVNDAVSDDPDLILQDNYGDGWLVKIQAEEPVDEDELKQITLDDI